MIELLGWIATAVFVGSYFFRTPVATRRVQMAGALLWIAYGTLLGALPVVVANLLVFGAAAWTAARPVREKALRSDELPSQLRAQQPGPYRSSGHSGTSDVASARLR